MISIEDAAASVAAMEELITFFPRDDNAKTYIVLALRRMCPTKEQLTWLTEQAINTIRKWEGLAQLHEINAQYPTPQRYPSPSCPHCDGTGFRLVDLGAGDGGFYTGVKKCDCWAFGNPPLPESGGGEAPADRDAEIEAAARQLKRIPAHDAPAKADRRERKTTV